MPDSVALPSHPGRVGSNAQGGTISSSSFSHGCTGIHKLKGVLLSHLAQLLFVKRLLEVSLASSSEVSCLHAMTSTFGVQHTLNYRNHAAWRETSPFRFP